MTKKQPMSLSIQTFEKLIVEGRIYVDKTQNIHDLITSDLHACLFSRPRRFGKSLTVTTLESIFLGKKELFEGLAMAHETKPTGILEKIRRWYNGYRFSKEDVRVYNPWSTLSLFQSQDFIEHWYNTGIPKMLVDIINRDRFETVQGIREAFRAKEMPQLMQRLTILIASIPGNLHTPKESYYHSLIHMVFQTSGLTIRSEEWVSGGRIDTVIEEPTAIYIIAFKFDGKAAQAVSQIQTRAYAEKYRDKPVYALGIGVACATKSIADWELVHLV